MIRNWTVKHVESLAALPEKLTIGRAYFVDSEHYIIIDHGAGPVIYGNREGQRGIPGAPIPELQAQINSLTAASFTHLTAIDELNERHTNAENSLSENLKATAANFAQNLQQTAQDLTQDINSKAAALSEHIGVVDARRISDLSAMYEQLQNLSQAVITITEITSTLAENLRGTESTILKLLLQDEQQNPITPLQQYESITTDSGYSWKVSEVGDDGTLVFILVDSPDT